MQLDILKCIAAYVLKNGTVSIPGVGSLYTELVNDQFVKKNDTLHPPRKTLTFDRQLSDNAPFIQHLASVFNVSVEKASIILNDWSKSIKQSLHRGISVDFPGLGSLNSVNNEIFFESIASNFHEDYLFYPSIPLVPLIDTQEEIQPIKEESEKIGKVSAIDRVDKAVLANNTGLDSSKSIKMENTNNRRDPYYDDDKGLFSEIGMPLFYLLLLVLLLFMLFKTGCFGLLEKGKAAATELVDTASETAEDVMNNASDALSANSSSNEEGYTGKYSDVLTQDIIDQGCVIVVGSFKNAKNALRMRNKIIAKGYQPFDEYHNDFNRIGLVFDCLDVDLVDFIQSVRRDIEPKAWYRIPGFKVPY